MKGIPNSSIQQYYKTSGDDHSKLSTRFFEGEEVVFDLSTNQVRFEINKNFQYTHNTTFLRSVSFTPENDGFDYNKEQEEKEKPKPKRKPKPKPKKE